MGGGWRTRGPHGSEEDRSAITEQEVVGGYFLSVKMLIQIITRRIREAVMMPFHKKKRKKNTL